MGFPHCSLRRGVLPDDPLHALLVFGAVLPEQVIGVGLRGRLGVGLVQEVLDSEQEFPDGDGRLPRLVLVEDREADGARGVYVRVEERRDEFA